MKCRISDKKPYERLQKCHPIRLGCPYHSMRNWQRNCVKPVGQRGEHRKSESVNPPGKQRHGEANAKSS